MDFVRIELCRDVCVSPCSPGKDFPKPEVKQHEEHLKNDARRDILKYFGQHNNQFVNSIRPVHLLIAFANVDDQIVTSMEALIQYTTKYATKE